jgi:ABC-2 type transport system permease protein
MSAAVGAVPPVVGAGRPGVGSLLADQALYASRELWRSRVALVFTFLLPLVWLLLIGALAGNEAVDETTGVRVMQFATPTAIVIGMLFAAYPPVAYSVAQAREQGIVKRLAGTPLPSWAFLAGRAAAALALALAAVAAMLLVGVQGYSVEIVWRTLPATIVTVVVGITAFAMLGLAVGVLARTASFAQSVAIATAVAVMFASGVFTIGTQLPAWLDTVVGVLPVAPLATALRDQFNPFLTGNGWDLEALVILSLWGLGGLVVATWGLRREPAGTRSRAGRATQRQVRAAHRSARGPARSILLDQAVWALRASLRDTGVLFFAIAMPLGLYALMAASYPGQNMGDSDRSLAFFFACSMSVYGVAIVGFLNNPESIATARDRLVLKRLRGTPLAPWQYLAGRTVSVVLVGALTTVLVFGAAIGLFGVRVGGAGAIVLAAGVVVLGALTMAACGYALVALAPSRRAVATAGLGLLLPIAFFSDVLMVGTTPEWMATVGSLFPLRHFVHALADALDPTGPVVVWSDLGVMVAWLVVAAAVAVRRFRWEPHGSTGGVPAALDGEGGSRFRLRRRHRHRRLRDLFRSA